MKRALLSLLAIVTAATACEKADPFAAKGSGALTSDETALLGDLPGGNTALFGGNYMKFQKHLADSPLGAVLASLNQQSPGLAEWTDCFIALPNVTMAGGLVVAERSAAIRFVMHGVDMPAIQTCASKAKFAATLDDDGKFVALEMPSAIGVIKSGYLKLPDGALLTAQSLPLGGREIVPVDRAMLEAESAKLATGSALLADKALTAAMPSLNRAKAIWFVGTGAGTPVAAKLGMVKGTMDISAGLAFDVIAQVLDKHVIDQLVTGVPEMKKQASAMGPELGNVMKALTFDHAGDQVHFALAIDNATLKALMKKASPMMGMGMR